MNMSKLSLILSFFFLPLSLFFNNLFLTIFIILFGIYTLTNFSKNQLSILAKYKILILIFNIPIALLLIGLTYSSHLDDGFKDLGRLIPLLFISIYVVINSKYFSEIILFILSALVLGSVIAALLCWGIAILEILQYNQSIFALLSPEYASHNLADNIGIHSPYLALFVNISIGFCVLAIDLSLLNIRKWMLYIAILILTLFLFNLMARNAIFCFIFFGIVYLLITKKILILIVFVGIVLALSSYAFLIEKNYLRDRFFKSVNVFETETIFSKKDSRFDRLDASYEVFKKFPILGPGTASEDKYRKEQFYINRDSEAYNNNYNAHNQFMEYLSTYGILGGITFILLFGTLFKIVYYKKSFFLFFLTGCFFVANLTESLFERSWGIIIYILLLLVLMTWDTNVIHKSTSK